MGQITVGPVSVSVLGATTLQYGNFGVSLSQTGTATVTLSFLSYGISGDNVVTLTTNQTTGAFSCYSTFLNVNMAHWSGSLQISFTDQTITATSLNVSFLSNTDSFTGQLIGW